MKSKLIGDRHFYRKTFAVMVPILIQNIITNFVSLLDNMMVGRVGTEPMSGVAIVNQLLFVFNLSIFGIQAGAGILASQYHGKGDPKGVGNTMKIKLYATTLMILGAFAVFTFGKDPLIRSFLHEGAEALDLGVTYSHASEYLKIMLWGLIPFGLTQTYAGTLRETQQTRVPMIAGITAVLVNLVFNYILIFGKLGAPALGVEGAAIATVLSRYVECLIVIIWTHSHKERNPFIDGIYRNLKVPGSLLKQVVIIGAPLFLNEFLWSFGTTFLNQCMSLRGLEVISALNISSTAGNLFNCAYFAMGNSTAILVGSILGSGDLEKAVDEDRKLLFLTFVISVAVGILMFFVAPFFPLIYNTTNSVRALAAGFLRITAAYMPIEALLMSCYFTMRCGGKTLITFLFDSCFVWVFNVPIAYGLAHFTSMPITPMYAIIFGVNILKAIAGLILVKKRKWVNNLVAK